MHSLARTLLRDTVAKLRTHGYSKHRVDTYIGTGNDTIRHHYAGGEYSLTRHTHNTTYIARWDARRKLPTTDQIFSQLKL
jgi:hypothetical protein